MVLARDNPNSTNDFHQISATLIVNLIIPTNLLVFVVGDAKPDIVSTKLDTLIDVIEAQTGLIVGVDKLTTREFIGANGTLETDSTATDVWFYLVDPESDAILPVNSSLVQR